MKHARFSFGTVAVTLLASLAFPTRSASVFDGFETYPSGSSVHGQDGWRGWDNSQSAGAGAVVSASYALDGANCLLVAGDTDIVRVFGGVSGGSWVFSLWQYVPSASSGSTYVILLNQYADGGPHNSQNWSVEIQNNLDTGKVISDLSLLPASMDLIRNRWVEYQFRVDFSANSVAEYYDGQLLSTHPWQDGGLNQLQAVDLYSEHSGPVYYDNLTVQQVPEPAVLTLLGLGAAALAVVRRRSRGF
jgi:hypothetical protein